MSSGDLPPSDPLTPDALSEAAAGNTQPLAHRAVRGGMWVVASSYWTIGFGFAANILLTRLLTPEVYGEYALAVFFATLFQLRTKVGLSYAFAQEKTVNGGGVGTVFALDVALGIGSVLVGAIAAPILLRVGYSPAIVTMMLVLLLFSFGESFLSVFQVILDKDLHFKPGSVIGSIILPLSYAPAFWLAWTGRGGWSLISQAVTFSLLSILFYAVFIVRRMGWVFRLPWRFERQRARRYVSYGTQSGIAGFIATMVSQTDNFVVGTRSGAAALGYYDRGYRTAQWPNLLLNTLLTRSALFTYAQLKDDAARLRKAVSMVIWLIVSLAAPIGLALWVTAPDLILLVYGERWLPAVPILRVLVAAAILRPLWDNVFALFVGTGRPRLAIWIGAAQLAIIFGLGWVLGGFYGPVGVGVAVIVAYVCALAAAHHYTNTLLKLDFVDLFAKPLLAAGLVIAGYALLNQLLPVQDWPLLLRTLAKGAYAVAGYYLISFMVQPRATVERAQYICTLLRRQPS